MNTLIYSISLTIIDKAVTYEIATSKKALVEIFLIGSPIRV